MRKTSEMHILSHIFEVMETRKGASGETPFLQLASIKMIIKRVLQ